MQGNIVCGRGCFVMKFAVRLCIAVSLISLGMFTVSAKGSDEEGPLMKAPPGYTVNQATQSDARFGKYCSFFLKDDLQEVRLEIRCATSD